MANKTNNRNRGVLTAKNNSKEAPHPLLNDRGRVTGCFYIRDDGTHIEYELATDPPEAAFWTTYRLKSTHVKVVGKYDRSERAALAREICNDIIEREKPVKPEKPKPNRRRRL